MRSRILPALLLLAVPALAAAEDRNVVSRIDVVTDDEGAEVRVQGSRAPSFTQFTLANPSRVVVDLAGAVLAGPAAEVPGSGVVRNVRTAMYTRDGVSMARVTLELAEEAPYHIDTKGGVLLVSLKEGDPARRLARGTVEAVRADRVAALAQAEADRAEAESARAEAERGADLAERRARDAEAALLRAEAERERAEAALADVRREAAAAEARWKVDGDARERLAAAAQDAQVEREAREEAERLAAEARRLVAEADRARAGAERQAEEAARRSAAAEAALAELAARAEAEAVARAQLAAQVEALRRERDTMADAQAAVVPGARYAYAQYDAPGYEGTLPVTNAPKIMHRVGFRQEAGVTVIFIRTNEPVRYSVSEEGDSVILELENTRAATWNDLNHLDTRFFDSPVEMIDPEEIEGAATHIRIHILLERRVPYEVNRVDNEIRVTFKRAAG